MNNITDILDITELCATGFGKQIIAESDCPLERLPDWRLIDNLGSPQSHFCYKDFGNKIVFTNYANMVANVQNLAFKNYLGEEAEIGFDVLFVPTGNTNWALYGVKFTDADNIIGVRINDGNVEIVQRFKGVWSTISSTSTGTLLGHWSVYIDATHISVNIAGTPIVTDAHSITGDGRFGLSGHRWEQGDVEMLENFGVTIMKCTNSIGGADGTEWNLNGTLENDCKICKN